MEEDVVRRVDDMIRENNRKFRQQKEMATRQKAVQYLHAEQEKEKLREYAKKIQQENFRKMVLAKEAKKKREKEEKEEKLRKKRMKLERQMQKERQEALRLQSQSRVSLSQQELSLAERRIQEKAAEELRRIKQERQKKKKQQQDKKMKLQHLDQRRRNIIERTRKVTSETKENVNSENIDEKKKMLEDIEKQTLKEIEMLEELIKKTEKQVEKPPLQHSVIEEETEEASETEEQDSFYSDERDLPVPIARQLIPQEEIREAPERPEQTAEESIFNQDIFRLSSTELLRLPFLKI